MLYQNNLTDWTEIGILGQLQKDFRGGSENYMNYILQSNKLMLSILVTLILITSAYSENIKMKN